MAFNKDKLYSEAIELTNKYKLFRIVDLVAFLPCEKSTFYGFFPDGSDELESIKRAFNKNKTEIKVSLKSKWFNSENPTLQVALFKLLADADEHRKLQQNYTDVTTGGDRININVIEAEDDGKNVGDD